MISPLKLHRCWLSILGLALGLALCGCAGQQSALDPAGHHARRIATLWWWMLGCGTAIWLFMMGITYYAVFAKRRPHVRHATVWLVIGGGVIVPSVLLTILVCFSLSALPPLLARPPAGSLIIDVEGIQWWWRVKYPATLVSGHQLAEFETANEICIPVDQPIEFRLQSHDVIHSFWIPALAGKVDMIPGRATRLTVQAYRTGRYRGACAEYCGESHALMNFDVRILSQADFEKWLMHQVSEASVPASMPADEPATLGATLFERSGCAACHTVRGTAARGRVGPDLTHFGSRLSIGAGIFPNDRSALTAWLRSTEHIKPGVHMPNFSDLGDAQLEQLASYLEQLR